MFLGIVAALQLIRYKKSNSFVDHNVLLSTPMAPGISIIAPAFNESKTIVDNINALLSIHYSIYEVIVVNDGSKDDTLEKVIKEYELEKVDIALNMELDTKEVRGIYKSRNKAYRLLTVIDKFNGGKADSLNAGINLSQYNYFVAIDVDSIIEQDALLKLVKPFLETSDTKVIATGGAIRIANSCVIENGEIVRVNVPDNLIARFQVVEYTRAFLMGRIAWSRLNSLLLVSGALGLFDKEIAINCGGYFPHTVGEDMELIVRMRRYMYDWKIKHAVRYIPDPLCWTEVPSSLKVLGRQRNRWTRGTMDTLWIHRKLFLNPKYGRLGLVGYPFWMLFEWMAPLIEFLGLLYFLFLILFSAVNLYFFGFLLLFAYLFAVAFCFYALLYDEFTYHKYDRISQIYKLLLLALFEPFSYHLFNVYWSVRGNIAYFKGEKTWGHMERTGFKENKKSQHAGKNKQ
jgi:cellulose synthase/poly-beta-1,6-N-acetylglucosamine synthase-like glycosyltransferase